MKKKIPALIFSMAIPEFVLMVRSKISFIRRDLAEFLKFGVKEETIQALEDKVDEYVAIPPDDDLIGEQEITTQRKDAQALIVRDEMGKILNRAANKFGEGSGQYRRFGNTALSDLADMPLYLAAYNAHRIGNIYLTDLASEGLTAEILTQFEATNKAFLKTITDQQDAIAARDIATENRITKANEIYGQISKHCETGKKIWYSKNEAKYNDYVIYDTPPTKPEEGENPPAA
jgi:hypothetical protein